MGLAVPRRHVPPLTTQTMFGNLGFGELTIIMVIVLVLFGAKRVPEISASFGKGIREFKRNLNDIETSVTTGIVAEPKGSAAWTPLSSGEPVADASRQTDIEVEREPKRLM